MNAKQYHVLKDESGITALETAIILIAFVVVAAIFAFTVLSTGTFLTEKSKGAAYGGLQEVRGSMEVKGSVVAYSTHTTPGADYISSVDVTLATVAGGASVDLCDTLAACGTAKVEITYHDTNADQILSPGAQTGAEGYWTVSCPICVTNGAAKILTPGALATITVHPPTASISHTYLGPYKTFSVEIRPPTGGVLLIERTIPGGIDTYTDLH